MNEIHLNKAADERDPPPVEQEAQQHVGNKEYREAEVNARHAGNEDVHRRVEASLWNDHVHQQGVSKQWHNKHEGERDEEERPQLSEFTKAIQEEIFVWGDVLLHCLHLCRLPNPPSF